MCEVSCDIDRIFIVQNSISDDQEIRQLVIYKASFYLKNSILYFLEANIDISSPISYEILIVA